MSVAGYGAQGPIVWLGLGQLGSALCARLAAAGLPLLAVDPGDRPSPTPVDVARYHSPSELPDPPALVIACLPSPRALAASVTWVGELSPGRRPSAFVNLSTVGPSHAGAAARALRLVGVPYVEAPVSGGVLRAREGRALLLVGSDDDIPPAVLDVLATMTSPVVRFGTVRAASAAKLINNVIALGSTLLVLRALVMARELDLDPLGLLDVLRGGTAASYVLSSTITRPMTTGDIATGFSLDLALKDMRLLRAELPHPHEDLERIIAEFQDAAEAGFGPFVFPMAGLRHLYARAG